MIYANTKDIPLPMQVWLLHDTYDSKPESNYISATAILKPVKEIILAKRVNPEFLVTDISDFVKARVGTALHDSIEQTWMQKSKYLRPLLEMTGISPEVAKNIKVNPKKLGKNTIPVYIEQRAVKEFEGYKIGGKFDFIYDGILHDFKKTSAYTWVYGSMFEKYKLQGSIYRWLNQDKITNDFVRICFYFEDWKEQLCNGTDYPSYAIQYKDIPLLSIPETELYLHNKLALINKYIDAPESDIPECTDEELWRSEDKYKYYSKPDAVRATKVFDTLEEANAFCAEKGKGIVKLVKGSVKYCEYCKAAPVCQQRRKYFDV